MAFNIARGGLRHRRVDGRARARLASLPTADLGSVGAAIDVQRALSRLTDRQREVTVLHYFCDLPVREIAAELNVDDGTVKTLLHRARRTLSEALSENAGEVGRAR